MPTSRPSKQPKRVLVTGGAGYIGSHTSRLLLDSGYQVFVLDSLETGYRQAVPVGAKFIQGTTLERALVEKVLSEEKIEAVIHFAAYKSVAESVTDPGKYFYNNVAGTLGLLEAMVAAGTKELVFSSTAAVYGNPAQLPATESLPIQPENPYGESKAMVERMLPWYERAHGIRSVILRYFNVAGAWLDGSLGEDPSRVSVLIPLVLQAAAGQRQSIKVFGRDYDTPDGTAIRDFIHVLDLAQGHQAALVYLRAGQSTDIFNLGTGQGYSVQEVIDQARRVTGKNFAVEYVDRRPGDPATVWADNTKAVKKLHWQPQYGLAEILESAWRWQVSSPKGFAG